jgi:hypothetical protein
MTVSVIADTKVLSALVDRLEVKVAKTTANFLGDHTSIKIET